MPFVKQDLRAPLLSGDIEPKTVGDRCFLSYSKMMWEWRTAPRWTTIHRLFQSATGIMDHNAAAAFLAFLEFYIRHGHKYELEKSEENGDI